MGPIYRCEKGFGLAETMVAAVILLLVALAAATVFYQGAISTVNTKHATEAIHKAHEKLEIVRAKGRAGIEADINLMPGPEVLLPFPISDNLSGTMTTTVCYVDDAADSQGIDDHDGDINDYLLVGVEIDWQENNQARVRRMGTIIQ